MYNNYEDIRSTLAMKEINCPEIYIDKALINLGYEKFPETGLNDKGRSRLINEIINIQETEASLSPRRYKTRVIKKDEGIIIQKEKIKNRKKSRSLEIVILKEDLQKIGESIKKYASLVLKSIFKTLTYPTFGVNFFLPTMFRKGVDFDRERADYGKEEIAGIGAILGGFIESVVGYYILTQTEPKWILPIAIAQITTNVVSGFYEWGRSIKRKADEKRKKNENLDEIVKS